MLKAAVIGCGGRGLDQARGFVQCEGIKLAALCDVTPDRLKAGTERFGVPGFSSVEDMLEKVQPEIVSIVTQPKGRSELTCRIAKAKGVKAIVAEKPMSLTMAEADAMVETCEKQGVILTISHQMRFCTEFEFAKRAIDRGEIGKVQFLRGVCFGNLLNQGTHVLDMVRWFAGQPKLEWVMASWENDSTKLGEMLGDVQKGQFLDRNHPAPRWMHLYFGFAGGIRASIESGLLYSRVGEFCGDWLQKRVCAIGSDGIAETRVAGHSRVLSSSGGGWKESPGSPNSWNAATPAFFAELRDVIHKGGVHRNDGKESVQTFEGLMACAQAALDGGIVRLPVDRTRNPIAELKERAFGNI